MFPFSKPTKFLLGLSLTNDLWYVDQTMRWPKQQNNELKKRKKKSSAGYPVFQFCFLEQIFSDRKLNGPHELSVRKLPTSYFNRNSAASLFSYLLLKQYSHMWLHPAMQHKCILKVFRPYMEPLFHLWLAQCMKNKCKHDHWLKQQADTVKW